MSPSKSQDDKYEALKRALDDFKEGEVEGESNADIADALLDSLLKAERARQGVDRNSNKWAEVDRLTIDIMKNWDSSDLEFAAVEKVLRKLASNEGENTVGQLKKAIERKAKRFKQEQSARARKPRGTNPIVVLIKQIVADTPQISVNALLHTLKKEVGGDVVKSETDDKFIPVDRKFKGIKKSGLRNHLHRAKKESH